MASTFHSRPGISAAELLAVVAILAVLVAMGISALVPRTSLARAQAELALCRQNLQKIGVGMRLYASNNQGSLPVSATLDGPHPGLLRALQPAYVADSKLFYCPGEQNPDLRYNDANFARGIIGYFYFNATQASSDGKLSKFLLTGVSWPRELNASSDKSSWLMSDIWLSHEPTAHSAYKKGVNYLTLDGSTAFVAESPRQSFR